ncbi:MAG TPA: transcription antitermination factor NusB [Clostridia bacterium]|nr:transcription antitermination factor NusB [Clostridia bacterium]
MRGRAREAALRALYQVDLVRSDPRRAIEFAVSLDELTPDAESFARELFKGVLQHLEEIDRMISGRSLEWKVDRMSTVDRNILRLSLYELLYRPDIPKNVSIDEAVEMAKRYSGDEAARFVNGILGSINQQEIDQEKQEENP